MAGCFRSVLEVLKLIEPAAALKVAAVTSQLWASAAEADELWSDYLSCVPSLPDELLPAHSASKLRYQQIAVERMKMMALLGHGNILQIFHCIKRKLSRNIKYPIEIFDLDCACLILSPTEAFVCGGQNARRATIIIKLAGRGVALLGNMIKGRGQHVCVRVGHAVYVFGGQAKGQMLLKSCEKFDLEAKRWARFVDMPITQRVFSACRHFTRIYLCGEYQIKAFDTEKEEFAGLPIISAECRVGFIYQEELMLAGNQTVWVLRGGVWEARDKRVSVYMLNEITKAANMSPVVCGEKVYITLFNKRNIFEIDLGKMQMSKLIRWKGSTNT